MTKDQIGKKFFIPVFKKNKWQLHGILFTSHERKMSSHISEESIPKDPNEKIKRNEETKRIRYGKKRPDHNSNRKKERKKKAFSQMETYVKSYKRIKIGENKKRNKVWFTLLGIDVV